MLIYEISNGVKDMDYDKGIVITGYNEEKLREADGILIIPEHINGTKVTAIRNQVFETCEDIKKVVIEGNIFLDYACFSDCFNMTSFIAPKITRLRTADIFRYCDSLTEVDLSSVGFIEYTGIFEYCRSLKKLELPKLKRIYSWGVFNLLPNLEELHLPNLEETGSLTVIIEDGREIELVKTDTPITYFKHPDSETPGLKELSPNTYYKYPNPQKDLYAPSLKKLTLPKQLINNNIDLSELKFEVNFNNKEEQLKINNKGEIDMEEILNKVKELKNLDCNETDKVVQLMRDIADDVDGELRNASLLDSWFYSDHQAYIEYDSVLEMLETKMNNKDTNDKLGDMLTLINNLKSSQYDWFHFDAIRGEFTNIDPQNLKQDKESFVEQAEQIFKEQLSKGNDFKNLSFK